MTIRIPRIGDYVMSARGKFCYKVTAVNSRNFEAIWRSVGDFDINNSRWHFEQFCENGEVFIGQLSEFEELLWGLK